MCKHEQLYFGSGDYYLFCRECHANWAMIDPAHKLAPELSNVGEAALLSGHERIAYVVKD